MTFFRRLALSAASLAFFAIPVLAQTTPLPELAPEVIAADVTTVFIDGEARRAAPTFDPFEATDALAGRANLREARGEVDRLSGEPILGPGAILDLAMLYTASSDEFDLRGYDGAVFLSGERVRSTRYNPVTRECSSRVTDVAYRDDYYAGVSHGLILGLYSAFPRYRGHRNYDFFLDGYRRPSWRRPARYARRGGFGGYRDGYRGGYSHGGFRDRGYSDRGYSDRRDARRDGHRDGRRDARRDDRGDDRRDARRDRREDRRDTLRSIPRNPRVGTGIGPLNTDRFRNARRNDAIAASRREDARQGGAQRDERQRDVRDTTERRDNAGRAQDRRAQDRRAQDRRKDVRRDEARRDAARHARSERREPAIAQRRETPRAQPRMENAPRANTPRVATPRPEPRRAEPRRSEPRRSEPARSEPRRSEPRRSEPSRSQPARSQRTNRSTDRAFRRGNARIKRGLDYYPQGSYVGSYVGTTVDTRCAKEEQLALFIPAERLDAARFDGLTVLVLDRNGVEIPVFVPPNYIEGFQQGLRRGETVIR